MAIKTNLFTDTVTTLFYNHVVNNDVFLVGSDYNLSNTSSNSNWSNQDVLERAIFGLKVKDTDISYMINNTIWEPGVVFQMYDDQAELIGTNFYVVVEPEEPTGDYYVFKCIFNNNGGLSANKPLYDENINDTGGESNLADGYIWKYLFTVPYSTVAKFKTQGYFPILEGPETANIAAEGIHTILVENTTTNFGYEKVDGVLDAIPDDNGRTALIIADSSSFNEAANIYTGMVLYVTKQENDEIIGSKQYVISGSGKQGLVFYVDIEGYSSTDFDNVGAERFDSFSILPRVIIEGNGEDAEGIVVFEDTNTRINSISMIARGDGYSAATAYIVDPAYLNVNAGDVRVELRPIVSPKNGHGSNIVRELRSKAVCVSGIITSNATDIPAANYYSKIALVSNPEFSANTVPDSFDNRVQLSLSASTGAEVGLAISQSNGVSGIIHEIDGNDIYVVNYVGANDAVFTTSLPLSLGSVDINISTVTESEYEQRSGDVFYFTDFQPVERTSEKREVIKILVDF